MGSGPDWSSWDWGSWTWNSSSWDWRDWDRNRETGQQKPRNHRGTRSEAATARRIERGQARRADAAAQVQQQEEAQATQEPTSETAAPRRAPWDTKDPRGAPERRDRSEVQTSPEADDEVFEEETEEVFVEEAEKVSEETRVAAGPRVTLDIKSLRVPPRPGTPALEASEPEGSLRLLARSEYSKARSVSLPAKAKAQARERVVPPWRVVEEASAQERATPPQRAPPQTAAREEEPHPPPSPSGPQPSQVSGAVVEHYRLTSTSLSSGSEVSILADFERDPSRSPERESILPDVDDRRHDPDAQAAGKRQRRRQRSGRK